MKKFTTDTTAKAKVAMMQVAAGVVLTTMSLFFKSIVVFVISIVILGIGINGVVNIVKGEA